MRTAKGKNDDKLHYDEYFFKLDSNDPEQERLQTVINRNMEQVKQKYSKPVELLTFEKSVNDSKLEEKLKQLLISASDCAFHMALQVLYSVHRWKLTPQEDRDDKFHDALPMVYKYIWDNLYPTTREYVHDVMKNPQKHPELSDYLMITFNDKGPTYEMFAQTLHKNLPKWFANLHYNPSLTFNFTEYEVQDGKLIIHDE